MAKQSGLGDRLYIDGVDISGDVGAIKTISHASDTLDVTAINKSAHERLYGQIDGKIEFNAFFNDAASQEHATLKAKSSGADRVVQYVHGSALGGLAATLVAKQVNYDGDRKADGSLELSIQCVGNGCAVEFGDLLTAGQRTDTTATNGASLDGGAASALGLAASLEVFAFTGTSVTVTIQESSDDAVGDPFAAVVGGAFAAVSAAPAAERIQTAVIAVERYLRVVTTGTFSNAVFTVTATRYP